MIPFKLKMSRFYHPYFKLKILVSEQANKEKNTQTFVSNNSAVIDSARVFVFDKK